MFDISRKFGRRAGRRGNRLQSRGWFPWISLLLLFGLAGSGAAAKTAEIQSGAVSALGPGPQFAIADFDGDLRPDLVSIQAGANISGSGGTNYWIQLQLTSAGRQFIQLVAPPGGLLIEARDVNGDHTVDLVLATAWLRQPVAIFLNDGHGVFSRAEATAFPGAFSNSTTNWRSGANLSTETVGVPPQSGTGFCTEERNYLCGVSTEVLFLSSTAGFPASPFLISQPGRAPPSEVRCS